MKKDHHRKIRLCMSGRVENPEPEVSGRVDGDVVGSDAFDGFGVGRSFDVEEVEEAAVDGAVAAACGVGYGGESPKS